MTLWFVSCPFAQAHEVKEVLKQNKLFNMQIKPIKLKDCFQIPLIETFEPSETKILEILTGFDVELIHISQDEPNDATKIKKTKNADVLTKKKLKERIEKEIPFIKLDSLTVETIGRLILVEYSWNIDEFDQFFHFFQNNQKNCSKQSKNRGKVSNNDEITQNWIPIIKLIQKEQEISSKTMIFQSKSSDVDLEPNFLPIFHFITEKIGETIAECQKSLKNDENFAILMKKGKNIGEFRLPSFEVIHGADKNDKTTIWKENQCQFFVDMDKAFFSFKLALERKRLLDAISKDLKDKTEENILVFFSGCGPFGIVCFPISKFFHNSFLIFSNFLNFFSNSFPIF